MLHNIATRVRTRATGVFRF